MTDLNRSWLVQRLKKPHGTSIFGKDNPFAFGGGLRNGGLSDEAMSLLRDVFAFDYMGSAEFEFGAVPDALNGLARHQDRLVALVIEVDLATVPAGWRAPKDAPEPTGSALIYALCRAEHSSDVSARIYSWTTERFPRLKEALHLARTLRPQDEWDGRTCGWLKLDNGFMFFTDRDMWEKTCTLFGVDVTAVAA